MFLSDNVHFEFMYFKMKNEIQEGVILVKISKLKEIFIF